MTSTTETVDALTVDEASHHLFKVSPEVNVVHLAFTLLSAFVLVFGMFSALIKERLYAGEAIVATAFGVIFGPYAANLFNPRTWGDPTFDDITLEFTRVVLALSVFAVGVELPKAYVAKHFRSLFLIIVPNMLAGWLITGGFIYLLVPGVNFLAALVIAACATPTDPILAASVVGKGKFAQKHVPSHIRHLLQCESGCNDGAAFPFLYLALFLIFRQEHNVGEAIGWWIVLVILYQIILGTLIGAGVGIIARKMLKFAKRRALIDRESMVAMYVSLALFTTAATTLAGSDDLLAAFACGTAFAWDDWFSESIEDSNFSNIIDLLVNCITFIYIGATMPFSDFNNSVISIYPWRLVLLGLAVLLLRRLPMMLLLYRWMPDIKTFREAVFAGWFGPMGVGAIFISTLALTKLPTPTFPPVSSNDYLAYTIQPVVYFLVLCSILVHGTSIPFFNLGRRVHSISRTWTQGSNAEPSWLSRVKRAGQDTNANRSPPDLSEKVRPKAERSNLDLEAGEFDDAGMDIGDVSSRDFLNSGGTDDADRVDSSGSGASGSDETRVPSKTERVKGSLHRAKRDLKEEHEEDLRRERHDCGHEEHDDWQEGSDIVRESDDGEHVEVEHSGHGRKDKHRRESDASSTSSRRREAAGPGFPGHRMAEIAQMIERGGEASHHRGHDKGTLARLEAKIRGRDSHESDDNDRSARPRDDRGDVSQEQQADEHAAKLEEPPSSRTRKHKEPTAAPSTTTASRSKPREDSSSPPRGAAAVRRPSVLDRMGLGAQSSRPSYLKVPRSNLTAEEKAERDRLCRKERKDGDDDEVKAWRDGNRLILERNNGEDVEVIELDPDGDTREKAKRDPNLRVRAVDEGAVKAAETDIKKAKSRLGDASESDQPKRMNLKSMASFKGFFGQDAERPAQSQSGPSTKANVPAIVREDEEEAATVDQQEASQSAPNPALLAVRKTGIPLTQTDTTESQIRWGDLPQPKRRR